MVTITKVIGWLAKIQWILHQRVTLIICLQGWLKNSGKLGIKLGLACWEAQSLPLCCADPLWPSCWMLMHTDPLSKSTPCNIENLVSFIKRGHELLRRLRVLFVWVRMLFGKKVSKFHKYFVIENNPRGAPPLTRMTLLWRHNLTWPNATKSHHLEQRSLRSSQGQAP